MVSLDNCWRGALLASALITGTAVHAAVPFPALDRPAMQVRSPERAVLLAAALAGTRVVAVGERGIVVLSDDGGRTWRQAKAVPVSVTLTALQFVDSRRGWAVGHGGTVLRSDDGGQTWVRQVDGRTLAMAMRAAAPSKEVQALADEGPDKPLLDLHFVDAKHGYIIGAYGLAFETRDAGATWTSLMGRLDNPRGAHLYSIAVRGESIFIVGEQGAMFRSQDAGATFRPLLTSYKGSWFRVVATPDGGVVAAGLRGNALYSADAGESWSPIRGAPPVTIVGGVATAGGQVMLANQAGQLMVTRAGSPFAPLPLPAPLSPPAGVLALPDGALLVVGMTGAIHLPSLATSAR